MDGDFGAQVVPPVFIHQTLPGRFCESPAPLMAKKRELPWQNHGFQLQQRPQQSIMSNSGLQNPENNWNPKFWDWDSAMFKAKPLPETVDLSPEPILEHKKKGDKAVRPLKKVTVGGEEENLTLNLGGRSYLAEEAATRPSKKVRSGSPGGGAYPMCQVDDCMKDLSSAKDYHRRHKVCEVHSKTTTALVAKQMQRFCQQCSRFHPLSEFDEGKRSCRRRLAGHNRRRRKTQPDDVSSRLFLPLNRENNGVTEGGNLDVVNLLTIIARLQENGADKIANGSSIPDGESLIQILSKINSFPVSADSAVRSSVLGRSDLNLLHNLETLSERPFKINGNQSAPSTRDLLAVLSAAVAAASPQALAIISNGCSDGNGGDRRNMNSLEKDNGCSLQKKPSSCFSSGGTERNSGLFPSPFPSPSEVSECQAQEARSCLPLQLFGSSPENDSPPKLPSSRRYFSSDSSNPIEERSPSSSPPVVRKLFPLDSVRQERMTSYREDAVPVEVSSNGGWASPLELFKGSNSRAENSAVSNPLYQAGYTSSSSDHSPSSSNFDIQDRTGRIIFKLFDKDPSNFPGTLRTQILDWLSHSPSEMESYIRPGCVILSVYMSMSSMAWDSLQEDFLQHVTSLIEDSNIDFWRSGRFLVQMDRKLASHKDGKIRLCKNWKTWSAPELLSVAPLAVVGGQETTLVLRGRNLTAPGTKIHCTYMGGYTSKEVSSHTYPRTIYEDSKLETFLFSGGVPNVFGRCFIEVENGFKGNSFPLIVADVSICQELRNLESELEDYARKEDLVEDQYFERPRSREDALQFLNELGWLFQRKCASKTLTSINFSLSRFKFLFAFSVERDWSALVKILLDVFIEWNSDGDGLSKAAVETLSEVHLLNRAVKRKCKKMIDLLLHYSVSCSSVTSKKYLFLPNLAGPGGLTPLHLAACMQDSEEMVDALTNDPQEIGLNCWISLLDANMQSPQMYASIRSHHSYNKLVNGKLADRRNRQFSITVSDAEISLDPSWLIAEREKPTPNPLQVRSCAQCAVSLTRSSNRIYRSPGLLNRPYVHSMLAIAAVCVCVCLFLRGEPNLGSVAPFEWENVQFGSL